MAIGKALRRRYRKTLLTFDAWEKIIATPFSESDYSNVMMAEKAVVGIGIACPVNDSSWVLVVGKEVHYETGTSAFRHFVPKSMRDGDETISNTVG